MTNFKQEHVWSMPCGKSHVIVYAVSRLIRHRRFLLVPSDQWEVMYSYLLSSVLLSKPLMIPSQTCNLEVGKSIFVVDGLELT
jgi:hypothetical protein